MHTKYNFNVFNTSFRQFIEFCLSSIKLFIKNICIIINYSSIDSIHNFMMFERIEVFTALKRKD